MSTNELQHHGTPGMKWGVRHGPPYPLQYDGRSLTELPVKSKGRTGKKYGGTPSSVESRKSPELSRRDVKRIRKQSSKASKQISKGVRSQYYRDKHTILKGTTLYRSVETDRDVKNGGKLGDGPTYVSYLDPDRKHYQDYMVKDVDKTATEYELRLKENLNVPSRDELKEVVTDVVAKNPNLKTDIVNGMFDYFMPKDTSAVERLETLTSFRMLPGNEKAKWKDYVDSVVKNTFTDRTVNEAFFMTTKSFASTPKVKDLVIKELKSRGYNAMSDEGGIFNREGVDPLIVFDSKVFEVVGKKNLNWTNARQASLDYMKYRKRANDQYSTDMKKRRQSDW